MGKHYTAEEEVTKLIDYQVQNAKRVFRFIITNDNDDSYIPKFKSNFIICDCSAGEDFTSGETWRKYFDECDNQPVLFINTSAMFQQYENKAIKLGTDYGRKGAGIWAQHMYSRFRDKMWEEKRTKFVFMVKDEDMDEMYKSVNAGFYTELQYYHLDKSGYIITRDFSYFSRSDDLIGQPITEESSTNTQEQSGPVLVKKNTPQKK